MNSMMFLFLQWGIKNFTIPIVLGSVHIHKKIVSRYGSCKTCKRSIFVIASIYVSRTYHLATSLLSPYYLLAYPNLSRTLEVVISVFFLHDNSWFCMFLHNCSCLTLVKNGRFGFFVMPCNDFLNL